MPLYAMPTSPSSRPLSPLAAAIRTKVQTLDRVGSLRALKLLNGMADHFLRVQPDTTAAAATRASTIAAFRAAGAELCVAYLEREEATN